jgi:hypothetical protein
MLVMVRLVSFVKELVDFTLIMSFLGLKEE